MNSLIPDSPNQFETQFAHTLMGIYGKAESPEGVTHYIQTKAKLEDPSVVSNAARLAGLLKPVREVFSATTFNELMQRDIDDRRVRQSLIPYLFDTDRPVFFPPIIALVVPFDGTQPCENFGVQLEQEQEKSGWSMTMGQAYEVGIQGETELAQLRWNPEKAKLVVIDGQHRAMALLALHRSMHQQWENSEYEYFYADLVEKYGDKLGENHIAKMEFPVTVCWFTSGEQSELVNQVRVARHIFVDLNSSANPVTPSRELLLNDRDIVAIGVRGILNEMTVGSLRLAATELDSPSADKEGPKRWSTITNAVILEHVVTAVLFGRDLGRLTSATFPTRLAAQETWDASMRRNLKLNSVFPATIYSEDGSHSIARDVLGRDNIPEWLEPEIGNHFMEQVGRPLVKLLYGNLIAQAHLSSLDRLDNEWLDEGDNMHRLARKAIMSNEGVYWSLIAMDPQPPEQSQLLRQRRDDFEGFLGEEICNRLNDAGVLAAEQAVDLWSLWRNIAVQHGLVLLYVTCFERMLPPEGKRGSAFDFSEFSGRISEVLTEAFNDAVAEYPVYLLKADLAEPRMQARTARIFRCRFIELLATRLGRSDVMDERIGEASLGDVVSEHLSEARGFVVDVWQKTLAKQAAKLNPGSDESDFMDESLENAQGWYADELRDYLGFSSEEREGVLETLAATGICDTESSDEPDEDDPEDQG